MPLWTIRKRRNIVWKMLKIILKVQEGEVQDREAKGWNVEGKKRRVARKECKKLRIISGKGFMAPIEGNVTLLSR